MAHVWKEFPHRKLSILAGTGAVGIPVWNSENGSTNSLCSSRFNVLLTSIRETSTGVKGWSQELPGTLDLPLRNYFSYHVQRESFASLYLDLPLLCDADGAFRAWKQLV